MQPRIYVMHRRLGGSPRRYLPHSYTLEYVRTFIYVHAYVCAYVPMCMSIRIYAYVGVYAQVDACICVCTSVCAGGCVYMRMHECMRVRLRADVFGSTRIHAAK